MCAEKKRMYHNSAWVPTFMRCVRILLKLFHFIHAFPKNFIISIVNRNQLILSTGKRLYVLPSSSSNIYIFICTYLWSCRELNILCIYIFCRHSLVHFKVAAAGETLLTLYHIFLLSSMLKDLVQFLKCSMVGLIIFLKVFLKVKSRKFYVDILMCFMI